MASYSSSVLRGDHFVPENSSDPAVQRKLRGQLEQIDYTAFASNRELIGQALGHADLKTFQRMALACAAARATWVGEALTATAQSHILPPEKVQRLAELRAAFEELSAAYEAARRLVERGYLPYRSEPK